MNTKELLRILKTTIASWNKHEAPRLGAALAFYTILSMSPLVILLVAIAGLVLSHSTVQNDILSEVHDMVGPQGAKAVAAMLANTQRPAAGIFGAIVGVLSLLFGASGVFGELRSALNKIWEVEPKEASEIWLVLRERVLSFGMVLSIGFLLMVSLILSTALAAISKFFSGLLPVPTIVIAAVNFLFSFGGIAVLFGLIFRFVPATRTPWRDLWPGSLVTALLFTIGKGLIGLYLGKASVGSAYGAAGSVIVLIVWVYYSAQIFFFGAEFTCSYRKFMFARTDEKRQSAARSSAAA
jgi:membrane protein